MGLRDIRPYFVIGTVILLSMPDWTDTAKVLHEFPTPPPASPQGEIHGVHPAAIGCPVPRSTGQDRGR